MKLTSYVLPGHQKIDGITKPINNLSSEESFESCARFSYNEDSNKHTDYMVKLYDNRLLDYKLPTFSKDCRSDRCKWVKVSEKTFKLYCDYLKNGKSYSYNLASRGI